MYLFVYDLNEQEWWVLVSKRGPGCPSNIGKWNVPGGYLDFNESLEDCARRECWEETGVDYTGPLTLASISTNTNSKAQNVVCSYYGVVTVGRKSEISCQFTEKHSEENEVSDIALWRVSDLFVNPIVYHDKTAYGHDLMIKEIFKKRIDISWWKKWLLKIAEKISKINLRIS